MFSHFDLAELIKTIGYLGIFFMVFAESGLFFGFFLRKKHLIEAQKFYDKHGGKTLILARFIPAVRTFVPIVAGMANMNYRVFISFNVFGGIFWVSGMTLAGYFLGSIIPNVH